MRILYGVQTTGNGHLSRSRLVISYLKQFGHDVHVLFSGAYDGEFWDKSVFEPYTKFKGQSFVHDYGHINAFKTLYNVDLNNVIKDLGSLGKPDFDLVISDFEPVSVAIARKHKIKSIGLSHQCAFIYSVPRALFNFPGKLVTRMLAPVEIPIGLHWHHFGQPILPPIINHQLRCDKPVIDNKILVYLPFESHAEIRRQLLPFRDHEFHVYEHRDTHDVEDNIHWKNFSRENFVNDLKSCSGVYCHAGFELPSEALHLGKKLLIKPVRGQFEQLSNAIALKKLGCGLSIKTFNSGTLQHWLNQSRIEPAGYPNVALQVAKWIGENNSLSAAVLSDYLWNKTEKPPMQLNYLMV